MFGGLTGRTPLLPIPTEACVVPSAWTALEMVVVQTPRPAGCRYRFCPPAPTWVAAVWVVPSLSASALTPNEMLGSLLMKLMLPQVGSCTTVICLFCSELLMAARVSAR
jgi:hypothetical protein